MSSAHTISESVKRPYNSGLPAYVDFEKAITMAYVEAEALAKQMAYRTVDDPRLERVCEAASEAIDNWCGRTAPFDSVPATIAEVALSLAVDLWKQPDATFGIMGMGETGPVRVARDLVMRYDASLIPFYESDGWGIA